MPQYQWIFVLVVVSILVNNALSICHTELSRVLEAFDCFARVRVPFCPQTMEGLYVMCYEVLPVPLASLQAIGGHRHDRAQNVLSSPWYTSTILQVTTAIHETLLCYCVAQAYDKGLAEILRPRPLCVIPRPCLHDRDCYHECLDEKINCKSIWQLLRHIYL